MKKKIAIVLAVALLCSLSIDLAANVAYGKAKDDLKKVQRDIQDKNKQLKEGKKKVKTITADIENLETRIGVAEEKIAALEGQIGATQKKVEIAKVELKKAKDEVDSQTDNLNVRLRAMYKNGSVGFLDVLLGSKNISEFLSNLDLLKKIHNNDKEVLTSLEAQHKAIEEKKAVLVALEQQLKNTQVAQAEKKKQLAADKAALAKEKSTVVAQNEDLQDNIEDLKAEEDRITSIINQNKGKSGGPVGTGQFTWPVPGHTRISSGYGWRNCPFHGREKHTGIDIPAPYGTSVVSADAGTVIFAGYLGSYGNAVIVSHGNDLYTLYGHNSSIVKWSGGVSKGQTIAKVGSTGSSTGNHCHFEVRKGGSSYGCDVNPWSYL